MPEETKKETVKVLKSWDETKALRRVTLEAGPLKSRHTTSGQYVIAFPDGEKEGFYAMANGPEHPDFELLIKRSPGTADAMIQMREGDEVRILPPAGKGFPVLEHKGRDLVLFAAGSAIAPLRSVIQQVLSHREDYGKVYLYYSHFYPSEFAYTSEFSSWNQNGIMLVRVATDPLKDPEGGAENHAGWDGFTGLVQDAFLASDSNLTNPAAYVCGMKEMVEAVIKALGQRGIKENQVFQNF